MKRPNSVEEYIASVPKEARGKLREMRAIIKAAAPRAEERISYGMPYYAYKGRLAYFGHSKAHLGLYLPTPVIDDHKKELKNYDANRATVRFPWDKKLPRALIRKLIKARAKLNESRR